MPNIYKKIFSTGLIWLWVTLLILIIDQYSKYLVSNYLLFGDPLYILPVFNLTLAHNTGAAFGFLHEASGWQNIFFGGLAVFVSIGILSWLWFLSKRDYLLNISLCFILGGSLGNAIDRVRFSYVIDFLNFHVRDWHFAIFNIADSAIFIGACLLMLHWWREK
jgi:signal peptidase II